MFRKVLIGASALAFGSGVWMGVNSEGTTTQLESIASDAIPVSALTTSAKRSPELENIASISSPEGRKQAAREWIKRLARTDPHAALAAANELLIPAGTRDDLRRLIYSIWAETAPEEATVAALAEAGAKWPAPMLIGVAEGWAKADPTAAIAWASGLSGGLDRRIHLINTAVQGGVRTDLEATAGAVASLPPAIILQMVTTKSPHTNAFDHIVASMAREDPASATDWLVNLPDAYLEAFLTRTFGGLPRLPDSIEYLGKQAPELLLRLAETRPRNSAAHQALISLATEEIAVDDFERAWALSATLTPHARASALRSALHQRTTDDPIGTFHLLLEANFPDYLLVGALKALAEKGADGLSQAMALSEELPEVQREGLLSALMPAFAKTNPRAAMNLSIASEATTPTLASVAQAWLGADRDGFETWLSSQPDTVRGMGFLVLAQTSISISPDEVVSYLSHAAKLPVDQDWAKGVGRHMLSVGRELAERDLNGATEWLVSLGDFPATERLAKEVTKTALAVDVGGASEWIARMEPGIARDISVTMLVNELANSDLETAFAWAVTIDDENNVGGVVNRAVDQLYEEDPDRLMTQLEALPPRGQTRDQAVSLTVDRHTETDPERSFALAATITNDTQRHDYLRRSLEGVGTNRERARTLIETLPTDAPDRTRLLQMVDDDRYFPF